MNTSLEKLIRNYMMALFTKAPDGLTLVAIIKVTFYNPLNINISAFEQFEKSEHVCII